jgi:hypothetical protein
MRPFAGKVWAISAHQWLKMIRIRVHLRSSAVKKTCFPSAFGIQRSKFGIQRYVFDPTTNFKQPTILLK